MSSMVDVARWRAVHQPAESAYHFLKDGIALDATLTYAELDQRARALAGFLQSRATRGDRILLLYPPGLHFISALFGCLYAGVLAVPARPLDPLRQERGLPQLQGIARDAEVACVLSTPEIVNSVERAGLSLSGEERTRWLATDDVGEEWCQRWTQPRLLRDQVAYLQYTSGSTSTPKGVMVSHHNLLHHLEYLTKSVDSDARTLSWMPHFHDYGLINGILGPLFAGIPGYLMPALILLSQPLRWLQAIERHGITHSGGPNFAYGHCVRRTTPDQRRDLDLSSWRVATCGAEPVSKDTMEQFIEAFGASGFRPEAFQPGYGLAEFTLVASWKRHYDAPAFRNLDAGALEKGLVREAGEGVQDVRPIVSCGAPLGDTRIAIVDPELLKRRNPDVVGEIWLAGPSVAKGYWNKPEETRETFDAHLADTYEGTYLRTGDLGFVKDGELFIIGRLKDLIIIRGRNHYPQDIERTVEQSHGMLRRESGAAFSIEVGGEERLVVVQEVQGRRQVSAIDEVAAAIRQAVAEQHDIQVHTVALIRAGSIPKTTSGKIQRRACRDAFLSSELALVGLNTLDAEEAEYVAPRNATEVVLAQIWGEILDAKDIGVHDNFFELGGHSLIATQMLSRLRALFRVEPPLRTVFETPTIAGIARWLTEQRAQSSESLPPAINRVSRERSLPLSFAQERMWFLYQLAPDSSAYNVSASIRLVGSLNKEAFAYGLNELVRRHESLRTTFHQAESGPVQRIQPFRPLAITEVDLRTRPRERREGEATTLITHEARRSFDLARDQLIRAMVIQVSDEEHVALLTTHHISSDQWSYGVIGRELVQCYNAFCDGRSSRIEPPLEIQYADFASWQRNWLRGPVLDDQLSYWKNQLTGVSVLALPADRLRPAAHSFRGSHVSLELPRSLIDGLKQLSVREGVTLYMVFLAGFVTLLHRLTGQEDVAVGAPIANRNWLEVEGLVGTFVNTLVLRTDVSGDPTFRELLARVRDVALAGYAHQDLPFEKLVEELRPDRSHGGLPLVQVMFNFVNTPLGRIDFKNLSWTPFEFDRGAAQFDLSLSVDPTVAHRVYLEFNTDLFDRQSMERWLTHYRTLLDAVLEQPESGVSRLPLLSESERRRIVGEWSGTSANAPTDRCLPQLFEEQVSRTPGAIAVESQGSRLTYAELNIRANQVAHRLRGLGVGPDVVVAILMERSVDLFACLIGIMKAGGAYLPLDPALPTKRMAFMLENSAAALLITRDAFGKAVEDHRVPVMDVDAERTTIERQSYDNPSPLAGPRNLAYVIYTSGSTGQPKGVEIEQGSLVNCLQSMRQTPGLTEHDVLLSVTTLSFDIAALELYLPLLAGATIIIATREKAMDGAWLKEQLETGRVTVMQATPATWRMVVEAGWRGNPRLKILCGGEALSGDLAEALVARAGSVWNMYGPTETTIWSTVQKLESGDSLVSIGRPIANTQIYILDSRLEPVPTGIPGELYIGGLGLARGYRHAPDLTAARFVANPLDGNRRMYRTGDQARWLPDGRIDCLGRTDHQVKVRGFRIEPGEIESILREYPEVKQCVVVVRHDSPGEKQVVAYVVPHEGRGLQPGQIRRRLRDQLPEYMVPAAVVLLSTLPLTPNGKVNRLALPPPGDPARDASSGGLTPRNRVELQLAAIWEQVLGVASIGMRDNFFDLGGHSLLALQIFRAVEQTFGTRLPMSLLLQAPTIEAFAEVLSQEEASIQWDALVAIQPGGSRPPFFAVPGVGGNVLVFARLSKQLGPEQPFYGLQARGLDGEATPFTRVEEMATHYLQQIRAVRPTGPYLIGGTCTGGVVAYEMAQQLVAQGERVILAIMESWHPRSYQVSRYARPVFLWPIVYFLKKMIRYWQESWRVPLRERHSYWHGRLVSVKNRLKREWFDLGNPYHADRVTSATLYAVSHYQPKPYAGRLLNVVASARPLSTSTEDTRLAWNELALVGGQTVYLPAEDSGRLFVPPHVHELGQHLTGYFRHECPEHFTPSQVTPPGDASRIDPAAREPILPSLRASDIGERAK
jgi:amino acid adenylation domain-containing protein